jgi:hypothetical protein
MLNVGVGQNTTVSDVKDGAVTYDTFMLLLTNRQLGEIVIFPLGMRNFPDKPIRVPPENGPKVGAMESSSGCLWNVKGIPISKKCSPLIETSSLATRALFTRGVAHRISFF